VITALSWRGLFNQEYGAVNLVLNELGIVGVPWLNTPLGAYAACLITNVWLGFPFMMVVVLGGLQAIPRTLYEAAAVDGAGAVAQFRAVTMPMLRPVLAPAAILGIVWTFNNLNVIWLVTNGGEPSDQTHILVSYVYKAAFNQYNYAYAAALSVVIFAVLLVLGLASLRRLRAPETNP
jgi:arabinogalactan oligomer/maltooligosaccharide transport system permease protein